MSKPFQTPMQFSPALAPFAKTIILSDGTRIALADSANTTKPALLLIHGLQDEADSWQHVFDGLSRMYRVVALDLPGFGRSDKRRRIYSIPMFGRAVLDVMTQLGIDKAALAGNSLGAMIAEYVALTHAPRVTQLALLSGTLSITQPPASPPGGLLKRLFADRLEQRYFAQLRADPQAAYATLQPYYHDLATLPEQQRAFLFQRVNERVWDEAQRRAARSVRNAMPLFFAQHVLQIKRDVAALRIPTQIIWGANDVIFATANGPARAARQSGAQYHELAQCGHLPQQEQPMQIVHALCA